MYIYIIRCGDTDMYKVGVTSNLTQRLDTLQTGCPMQLRYTYVISCNRRNIAYSIEATLHSRLKPNHLVGEWYTLDNYWLSDVQTILGKVGNVVLNEAEATQDNLS
jgi:hypothetical protein